MTVIIVTFNSADSIRATLASVDRCRTEGLARCIVVDNASTDETRDLVCRHGPWADLIESRHNLGFARGCNLGLERVDTPYTLFLNPDAAIEPGALRVLLDFLSSHDRVGIVGPATICRPAGEEEVLQLTGPLPTPRSILPRRLARLLGEPALEPIVPGAEPYQTGWICGAVLLAGTPMLRELGGFDPRFFLYWEETDLCLRARDAGYQAWAVGSAVARHAVAISSRNHPFKINGCIAEHYYQSRRYYMLKHYGWWKATTAEAMEWIWLLGASLLSLARGSGLREMKTRFQAPPFSLPVAPAEPVNQHDDSRRSREVRPNS